MPCNKKESPRPWVRGTGICSRFYWRECCLCHRWLYMRWKGSQAIGSGLPM